MSRPPFLDDQVEYIGVFKLRYLTIRELESLKKALVVMPHYLKKKPNPVAVVIPYEQYLVLQNALVEKLGPILDKLGISEEPDDSPGARESGCLDR